MAADVLDRWAHARISEFTLSSGIKVEVEALDLRECLRYGKVPNALIGYAQKVETGSVNPAELDEKASNEWFDFRMWVIAEGVKTADGEEVSLEPEWVSQHMPPMDRELIWSFRTHLYNAEAAQGLMTLLSAASFRDEPASNGNRASRRAKASAAK